MAGPIVGLGDGGAGAGAHRQVTRDCQRLGRQRLEAHLVAPFGEESPLGAVDAAWCCRRGRTSRASATPRSASSRAGIEADGRGTIWGSLAAAVIEDLQGLVRRRFRKAKSCAINVIIARRMDVRKRPFSPSFAGPRRAEKPLSAAGCPSAGLPGAPGPAPGPRLQPRRRRR